MNTKEKYARPLESALADWANDDLLISDKARANLHAQHPRVASLLDWPALRTLFQQRERSANQEKRCVRKAGWRAVWSAFLAFTFTALSAIRVDDPHTALSDIWIWFTGVGAFVFATICIGTGLFQMFHGGRKSHWMVARLWTETLRRLYFQFLLRNLPVALEVMTGARPLTEWHAMQADTLAKVQGEELASPDDALRRVLQDATEGDAWILPAWRDAAPTPALKRSPELEEFLEVFEKKRLQLQKDYTNRKLEGSRLALRGRTRLIRAWFYFFVFVILILDAGIGILRIVNEAFLPTLHWMLFFELAAAVTTAGLVSLQMWDRGEQISGETDRMEWYLATVDSIYRRYQMSVSHEQKIGALNELEAVAYREMRQFLLSADRGEFVAG